MLTASDLAVQFIETQQDDEISTFLEMSNRGSTSIGQGWRLYFSLGLTPIAEETRVSRTLLDGRYGYIEPTNHWPDLAPGESLRIRIENWLFSGMHLVSRQGLHLTELHDGSEQLLGAPTRLAPRLIPLTRPRNRWAHVPNNMTEAHTETAIAATVITATVPGVIPAVKEAQSTPGHLKATSLRVAETPLNSEATYLRKLLLQLGLFGDGVAVHLSVDPTLTSTYELDTTGDTINIVGKNEQGVFYGIQTLRQLIQPQDVGCSFPAIRVADSPDFQHRAFFLDIARHFQPLDQLKKTIEVMATYKMNRLQLGLSNDEGWRLEIPAIPELTSIGARRSYHRHNPDGTLRALYPAWGDDHQDYEGYISRNEFVDLLRHASKFHVEIIPEFNLPGHANALVQSINATDRWLITDPDDTSVYRSAQGYSANVINVGMEDCYRLARVVLEEISAMYADADVSLSRIHLGGDEVPVGAWLHSPACHRLPVWDRTWDTENPEHARQATAALMAYHQNRMVEIAAQVTPGIQTGFWHEMSPYGSGNSNSYYNVWLTADADSRLVSSMLDRGQNLVISNATYLYLDQPYAMSADEPGLPWAGYTSTKSIYHFDPVACWGLDEAHIGQVLGIQAQLWSETVFTPELMDYYTFPRLLAVAERAWNRKPQTQLWSDFYQALVTRELPHLDRLGVSYRKPRTDS